MECWFTTSHGDTVHNNPETNNYVPGEPPLHTSSRMINYRKECLKKGFARVGWPNTGDLRQDHRGEGRLAPEGYSFSSITGTQQNCLENFSKILAGDFIIIPADEEVGNVHLGIVLTTDKLLIPPYLEPRPNAYFYHHNISAGDYYECAHRVNVKWAMDVEGDFQRFQISKFGGVWRQPFSHVIQQKDHLFQLARQSKLF